MTKVRGSLKSIGSVLLGTWMSAPKCIYLPNRYWEISFCAKVVNCRLVSPSHKPHSEPHIQRWMSEYCHMEVYLTVLQHCPQWSNETRDSSLCGTWTGLVVWWFTNFCWFTAELSNREAHLPSGWETTDKGCRGRDVRQTCCVWWKGRDARQCSK